MRIDSVSQHFGTVLLSEARGPRHQIAVRVADTASIHHQRSDYTLFDQLIHEIATIYGVSRNNGPY